ncbi:DoxX family protein [Agrobacterium pusense]|nr:DoxX family membrane protein [Agrobacterium pusense]PZU76028.1 MAG: DoxX family protein [Rhizobium sp.]QBJ13650.1 DoxX family protein [Agrobacterium sp. 33MFTa1.1]QSZ57523.1 DoxX family protein [Rhizobium sp. ZX09]RAL97761.1 DoxX family protein [Agrobacterium sp. MS2]TGR70942.1 DoxX family protein [bacterium M00.F.Ca.ET.194.01.1.1]TGS55794.1 DoxX family protein [bacterium M00.F.Ca.ET.179.01.1.1]TGV48704.1 DoxX family protein [bacterium M00.F.Ca.ET.168.01.1.1]HCJ74104.1 DoxX family protei
MNMAIFDSLSRYRPQALGALRIMTALLFISHGTQKLFGFPASQMEGSLPTMLLVAAILEFVGGILVLIGLFTRPVAFILSGQMAVAYFIAHGPKSFFPALNGGDAAILFCFIFLYLFVAGPGAFSVDERRA